MDEDGNGLDDEIEQQLAECFVPAFRFDADEPSSSLQPNEPVAGFSAYRIQAAKPDEVLIRFEMVALWKRDAGFPNANSADCSDYFQAHDGDSWGTRVDVRVFKDAVWRAELAEFSTCWPAEMHGTHPVIYPSAGKHHDYCSAGVDDFDITGGTWCTDPHRGNGAWRVPSPLFRISTTSIRIPTSDGNVYQANACTFVRTGQKVVASRLQPHRLDNLGFAGQSLWQDFYTGGVTGPGFLLAPGAAFTLDPDGDGRPESDWVATDDTVTVASDLCPLDSGPELDADGDHLYGACDFDGNFRQSWVGIGTADKPAVPQTFSTWNPAPTHAFGGFLDTDQDGSPNGVEACPKLSASLTPGGGITLSNRWGEDENWAPHPTGNNELGALQRDSLCDPYPVAFSSWNPKNSYLKKCGGTGWVSVGQTAIGVTTRVSRGVSANDPFWNAPKKELPVTFTGQTHRCACRDQNTGAPLSGSSCVRDPASDCYRATAEAASSATPAGRGWRPIDRPGCTRDPDSWCDDLALTVPRFDSTPEQISWRWRDELTAFGPTSATPHFAPGDVLSAPATPFSGAYQKVVHSYATWTLPNITAPPALPGVQAAFSFHHDPEYDPQHRADALWNVKDHPSRRLRASFSEQSVSELVTPHSAFSLAPPCAVLTIDQQLLKAKLWFGPDPVKPELTGFGQLRLLLHDGGLLTTAALANPSEGGYAALTLGTTASQSWLATQAVLVAPVASVTQAAPAQAALAASLSNGPLDRSTEPLLLAVERAPDSARWALLAPQTSTDTSMSYETVAEGVLAGGVGATTELVADSAGTTLALVDLAGGWFEWFSVGSRLWARNNLPAELTGRSGAALALWGAHLLIAGGEQSGALASDLWDIGLFGGPARAARTDLPTRLGAQLSVTPGGESVILVGGTDATGTRHDDVWQLASFSNAPRRVFADTTRAAQLDARTTVVFDAPYEGALRALAFDPTRPELVVSRLRTLRGWEEAVAHDEPRACAATDPAGGRLCALAPEWWSNPGAVPCGSSSASCEGSRGSLEASAVLTGSGAAIAVDTDGYSVWALREKSIERWSVASSLPALIASAVLPAKARALSAGRGGVVIATDAGVVMVRPTDGGLGVDAPLAVCGRPLRIASISDTSWAIATTVGLALVGGPAGQPLTLRSMSVPVPAGPKLLALEANPAAVALCDKADAHLPSAMVDALAKLTAVAAVDDRVLLAAGPLLFDVRAADLSQPSLGGKAVIGPPLEALRIDPIGQRAYGTSHNGQHRPILDLRGAVISLGGQHQLESWVRRRDGTGVAARVSGGKAEVAKVVP